MKKYYLIFMIFCSAFLLGSCTYYKSIAVDSKKNIFVAADRGVPLVNPSTMSVFLLVYGNMVFECEYLETQYQCKEYRKR